MSDKEERLQQYLETLVALGRTAEGNVPLASIFQRTCILVARAIHVPHVKIMRYRLEEADLFIEAGFGWEAGVVGVESVSIDVASAAGRALQTAQPVTVENIQQDPIFRYSDVLRRHGIVSAVNVPIVSGGDVWGTLEADDDRPRGFDENEICFLVVVSQLLAGAIQRSRQDAMLHAAAEEKARSQAERELLLQEIEHRVKNNFQVISSIVAIEQRQIRDEAARRVLQDVLDRITAMALAHDQLSLHAGDAQADLARYLEALCASLNRELQDRVRISTSLQGAETSLRNAVPLGLIVNEAITNAAKYAYGEETGPVDVMLQVKPELSEGMLTIRDSGSGIEDQAKLGTGTRLMDALARQVGGTIERISSAGGTTVKVTFPLDQ